MNANPTSEEKLLKLLRAKDSKVSQKSSNESSGKSSFSERLRSARVFRHLIQWINILLIFLIIGLGVVVFMKFWKEIQNKPSRVDLNMSQMKISEVSEISNMLETKTLNFYKANLSNRDFFKFPEEDIKISDVLIPKNNNFVYEEWDIVGVLMEDFPQVVMEDPATKQTIFLSEGEFIGEAQLKEVSEEKIIFMYKDELIEITY